MSERRYVLWVWEGSWRVLASYADRREARRALDAQQGCELWAVLCREGDARDVALRANCRDHSIPQRIRS